LSEEELAELDSLLTTGPIDLEAEPVIEYQGEKYVLHPGQSRTFHLACQVVIVSAGWQGGKTEWSLHLLLREIQRKGPGDYGAVGPTFPLLNKKLIPVLEDLYDRKLGLGRLNRQTMVFEFSEAGSAKVFGRVEEPVKTRIYLGYGSDPASLEAGTWKAVLFDEAGHPHVRPETFEVLDSRVARHRGRQFYLSRPYGAGPYVAMCRRAGYHWSWQVPEEGAEPVVREEGDPGARVAVVNFSSLMNPAFPPEEYFRLKAEMPAWKFSAKYDGIYVKPAGAIYDCFERSVHTYKGDLPDWWPRHIGIDFGPVNTAACFAKEDPGDGTLYVYSAYKGAGETASVHVPKIKLAAFPGDWEDERRAFDSGFGGSWSENDWRTDYWGAGLPLERPPIREVEVGIQRVYRLLKLGKIKFEEGLEWVLRQFEEYSRELDDDGEPKEGIEDKEKFHGCDMVRYLVGGLRPTDEWIPGAYDTLRSQDEPRKLEPKEADREVFERNTRLLEAERLRAEDRGELEEAGFESPVVY